MSRDVYARPYDKDDPLERQKLVEWLHARRRENRFDPRIFEEGQAQVITCFDETGIVGFVPVTLAFVLESLAFPPGTSPLVEAQALRAAQGHLVWQANKERIPNAFFVTFDEDVRQIAQRHGWKPVAVPMLNLDFNGLEPREAK